MHNKIRLSFLVSILLISSHVQARAETVLFFAPTRLEINDKKPVQEIRVTNMSKITRSYQISIENLMMNENGQTARVDSFNFSAKRMLRFVPRQFDLKPGERQIIRVMARFPEGVEDGEYHSHLEFLENIKKRTKLNKESVPDNKASIKAEIAYSTSIPIIISKGEIKTDVGMKNITIGTNKDGSPEVLLSILRSGNGQGNVFLEADYISPDGKEVKAAVRRTVSVYREIDYRNHSFVLELLDEKDLQKGGKIRVKLYNRDISEEDPVDVVIIPAS